MIVTMKLQSSGFITIRFRGFVTYFVNSNIFTWFEVFSNRIKAFYFSNQIKPLFCVLVRFLIRNLPIDIIVTNVKEVNIEVKCNS